MTSKNTLAEAKSLLDAGKFEDARVLASSIPHGDPGYLNARYIVARSHMGDGNNEAFLHECEALVVDFPNQASCFQLLGVACSVNQKLDESEAAFRQSLALNSRDRASAENLGIILDQNGWQKEAFVQLRQVLQQFGGLGRQGYLALIRNALLLGERKIAHDALSLVRQSSPNDPDFMQLDARNAFAHHDQSGGLKLLKSALRQFPENPDILADNGVYTLSSGDTKKAGALFRKAIRFNPGHSGAHYVLADMGGGVTDKKSDDRADRLEKIDAAINDKAVPYLKRAELGFAAGKIHDSLKQYDEAFASYDTANKMIWERLSASVDGFLEEFSFAQEFYEQTLASRLDDVDPDAGNGMIYLVGMPRSGTTLLEQMLSGLKSVTAGGETGEINAVVQQIPHILGKPDATIRILENASATDMQGISTRFIEQFRSQIKAGQWRTNKDMQLFLHLGLIRVLFPAAKIIHCRRNPVDTCVSAYFQFFKLYHQQFSFNLAALGRYYRAYDEIMTFWQEHLPMDMAQLYYEDLVADPAKALKPVAEFCGVEWSEDALDFEKSKKVVNTASIWQVRQKLNSLSVERWRRYEKHLSPLLDNLGDLAGCRHSSVSGRKR